MSEAEEGLKEKFNGLYEGPFRISRVIEPSIYNVSNLAGKVQGVFFGGFCFVDRASRYNCVKNQLLHNLFLVYFLSIYMFWMYLGPSSGGKTIRIQQLVIIILFRSLSVVLFGLSSK
jgi:hypothetical protein